MAGKGNRGKEIVFGILLLIPVAIITYCCVYIVRTDVVLRSWLNNVVRVYIIAISAIILYFMLVLTFSNLKKAFELIFKIQVGKKK